MWKKKSLRVIKDGLQEDPCELNSCYMNQASEPCYCLMPLAMGVGAGNGVWTALFSFL